MTPRTILEIARRFCYGGERAIAFDQRLEIDREALVEFAKAVIEADRESSGTTKQLAAYKTLVGSFEKQITAYRQRLKELEGAEASLDSERECNARLTKELEAQEKAE